MRQDDFDKIRDEYSSDILGKRENVLKECKQIKEDVKDPIIGLAMQQQFVVSEMVYMATVNNVLDRVAKQQGLEFEVFKYEPVGSFNI